MHRSTVLRLAAVAFLTALLLTAFWLAPSLRGLEAELRAWRGQLGYGGLLVLAAAYTPVCLAFIPVSLLSLTAGYFYPVLPAIVAVSLGLTGAGAVVFLLGRTLARGWVVTRFGHSPRFQALDQAVAEQGFKIVLLTRLSPVLPFIFLNYAFSLTRVSFRSFVLATWLGTLPSTVLFVYVGSTVQDFTQLLGGGAGAVDAQFQLWHTVVTVVGLLATLAVTVMVTRLARKALRQALPLAREETTPEADPEPLPDEQPLALAESSSL
jgi:uncharacterized membrane protein YdjX (TVP38/TMEM64 family)